MGIYLLKSTAILAIFWTIYVLFLERENMHRFKRFYLLTSIIAAVCIPLFTLTEFVYVQPMDGNFFQNEVIPFEIIEPLEMVEPAFWNLERILWAIYSIGVVVFTFRFLRNLTQVFKTINTNETHKQSPITFVLLKQLINPHTFFNYIFLNKIKFENKALPKEVILHEETHAIQKHSLDILFIELLQIIFWFQPFIWLYKKRIKMNHEFLADQAVIENGFEPAKYQYTLLSYSSNNKDYALANAINYSSIKKRFTVMKTQTSKQKKWLFSLLILPVLGILFYSFSGREIVKVEKKPSTIDAVTEELKAAEKLQMTYLDGASEKLMKEYKSFIKTYNETKIIYGDKYERAIIIYDKLMSDIQRASVEKYPPKLIPPSNLAKTRARKLSSSLFEDLKNEQKYAIWIDKKHVSNSELNNYDVKDFVHYTGSSVFKNARSKKFPQPNQYRLFTKAGFKSTYQDSQLKRYNKAAKIYTDAIKVYLKGEQADNSELIILKSKADDIYKTFSVSEIKNYKIKTVAPVPTERKKIEKQSNYPQTGFISINGKLHFYVIKNNSKHYYNSKGFETDDSGKVVSKKQVNASDVYPDQYITKVYKEDKVVVEFNDNLNKIQQNVQWKKVENILQQKIPTKKEIAEYNTWAKAFNQKIKKAEQNKDYDDYPIIRSKDLNLYKSIYGRMSNKQKEAAERFPNIPPPPPPAPASTEKGDSIKDSLLDTEIKSISIATNKGDITINKMQKDKNLTKTLEAKNENCLEFPNPFKIENNKTLTLNCINDYPENKLDIYNRWGAVIFSKENYTNKWDGYIDGEKANVGTYYYMFSSPKLKEQRVGHLYIEH